MASLSPWDRRYSSNPPSHNDRILATTAEIKSLQVDTLAMMTVQANGTSNVVDGPFPSNILVNGSLNNHGTANIENGTVTGLQHNGSTNIYGDVSCSDAGFYAFNSAGSLNLLGAEASLTTTNGVGATSSASKAEFTLDVGSNTFDFPSSSHSVIFTNSETFVNRGAIQSLAGSETGTTPSYSNSQALLNYGTISHTDISGTSATILHNTGYLLNDDSMRLPAPAGTHAHIFENAGTWANSAAAKFLTEGPLSMRWTGPVHNQEQIAIGSSILVEKDTLLNDGVVATDSSFIRDSAFVVQGDGHYIVGRHWREKENDVTFDYDQSTVEFTGTLDSEIAELLALSFTEPGRRSFLPSNDQQGTTGSDVLDGSHTGDNHPQPPEYDAW